MCGCQSAGNPASASAVVPGTLGILATSATTQQLGEASRAGATLHRETEDTSSTQEIVEERVRRRVAAAVAC